MAGERGHVTKVTVGIILLSSFFLLSFFLVPPDMVLMETVCCGALKYPDCHSTLPAKREERKK